MNICPAKIRIGARRSALALAQAHEVKNRLLGAYPDELTQHQIEIVKIETEGDKLLAHPLAEIGGKGLFIKELEEALLADKIDLAVHSMKDMPYLLHDDFTINCIIEREDIRDVFLANNWQKLTNVPLGSVIGTSSLRRRGQLKRLRPDLKIVPIRGNILTRIQRLEEGVVDGIILALGGLKRLALNRWIKDILPIETMLPATAQAAIGIETLKKNKHILNMLEKINHQDSFLSVKGERAFSRALESSCITPIASHAKITGDKFEFQALIVSTDGKELYKTCANGNKQDIIDICFQTGEEFATRAEVKNILARL